MGLEESGVAISDTPIAGADTVTVDGTFTADEDWAVIAIELLP